MIFQIILNCVPLYECILDVLRGSSYVIKATFDDAKCGMLHLGKILEKFKIWSHLALFLQLQLACHRTGPWHLTGSSSFRKTFPRVVYSTRFPTLPYLKLCRTFLVCISCFLLTGLIRLY